MMLMMMMKTMMRVVLNNKVGSYFPFFSLFFSFSYYFFFCVVVVRVELWSQMRTILPPYMVPSSFCLCSSPPSPSSLLSASHGLIKKTLPKNATLPLTRMVTFPWHSLLKFIGYFADATIVLV